MLSEPGAAISTVSKDNELMHSRKFGFTEALYVIVLETSWLMLDPSGDCKTLTIAFTLLYLLTCLLNHSGVLLLQTMKQLLQLIQLRQRQQRQQQV